MKATGKKSKTGRSGESPARKAGQKTGPPPISAALPLPEPSQDLLDVPVLGDPDGLSPRSLELARARWEQGDWRALLALDTPDLERDADRAKLALLLAAAHSQTGDMARAKDLAARALAWGASRTMTARVLLSAAQNSLGRASASLDEDATPHFEAALCLVQPHGDMPLLARTRRLRELAAMGLLPEAADLLEAELGFLADATPGSAEEQVAALQGQIDDLRKLMVTSPQHPAQKFRKRTIVIAGVPRSGSTWLYNVTRLLLERSGYTVYARWQSDYMPEFDDEADVHVVKVHNSEELRFPYDLILTTNRDVIDRLASLIRMGWLEKEPQAVRNSLLFQQKRYEFWNARTNLEIDFEQIRSTPENAIQEVAHRLEVPCNPTLAATIRNVIDNLAIPQKGEKPDIVTQLHPAHRSDGTETAEIAQWIRSTLLADALAVP